MNFAEFQLQASGDPRLAAYAASPLPAWLWSSDGTRILWANPAGAGVFGAADGAALANRIFGPADRHRRQVARLAARRARERRHPAGAAARFWRGARHARDLRLSADRFSRRQPRPSDCRQRAAGRARTACRRRCSPTAKPAEPPAVADVAPLPAAQPAAVAEQPSSQPVEAEFALFDAFAEPSATPAVDACRADELPEPDLESVLQLDLPHVEADAARAARMPKRAGSNTRDRRRMSRRPRRSRRRRAREC